MKANSLEELVTNSNIAGELRNYTDWHTRLVKFAQLVADWQEEQMLKDAVEGEARIGYPFSKPFVDIEQSSAQWCNMMKKFMNGDKVRIIVLKEKEE